MEPLFSILERCEQSIQTNEYHLEDNVMVHCLQTMNYAFRETNDVDLIIAAMMHDCGKCENFMGHAEIGADMLVDHVSAKAEWLVRNHMRFWDYIDGHMHKLNKVTALSGHPWFVDLVQLGRWDKAGRNPNKKPVFNRRDICDRLNLCVIKKYKGE